MRSTKCIRTAPSLQLCFCKINRYSCSRSVLTYNVLYGHGQLDADRRAWQAFCQYSGTVQHWLLVLNQNGNDLDLVLWASDASALAFHHSCQQLSALLLVLTGNSGIFGCLFCNSLLPYSQPQSLWHTVVICCMSAGCWLISFPK